jgi:RNA polymerase sigma-70 factor (ECF subfamily)
VTDPIASPNDEDKFRVELLAALPHLRAFARGLCGRRDYADDLVQEAAIKAWGARERFQDGTNLRAWTFAILRNHFLNDLRRYRREVEYDPDAAERMLVEDPLQEAGIHIADMQDALQKLPQEQREALLLIGASGFTYQEAAEICGVATGTIKSRVARGRSALVELLQDEKGQAADGRFLPGERSASRR